MHENATHYDFMMETDVNLVYLCLQFTMHILIHYTHVHSLLPRVFTKFVSTGVNLITKLPSATHFP